MLFSFGGTVTDGGHDDEVVCMALQRSLVDHSELVGQHTAGMGPFQDTACPTVAGQPDPSGLPTRLMTTSRIASTDPMHTNPELPGPIQGPRQLETWLARPTPDLPVTEELTSWTPGTEGRVTTENSLASSTDRHRISPVVRIQLQRRESNQVPDVVESQDPADPADPADVADNSTTPAPGPVTPAPNPPTTSDDPPEVSPAETDATYRQMRNALDAADEAADPLSEAAEPVARSRPLNPSESSTNAVQSEDTFDRRWRFASLSEDSERSSDSTLTDSRSAQGDPEMATDQTGQVPPVRRRFLAAGSQPSEAEGATQSSSNETAKNKMATTRLGWAQLVDAIWSTEELANTKQWFRSVVGLLVGVLLLELIPSAAAQVSFSRDPMPVSQAKQADQYVTTGMLEHRDDHYVLVDEQNEVKARLAPRSSLDLSKFVNQQVRVTVREPFLRITGKPELWVDHIVPLGAPAEPLPLPVSQPAAAPGHTMLAQHTEPIMMEGLPTQGRIVSDVAIPKNGGPPGWIWGSAEYLAWWTDGMNLPPLVTTSPVGTPRTEAGVLGESGTLVVYGNEEVLDSIRNGLRLRSGVWFDRDHRFGLQGEYLSLERDSDLFMASSDASGVPIIARPFFNINPRDPLTGLLDPPAREDSELVAYPGVLQGSLVVDANTRLESGGLTLRALLAGDAYCTDQGTGYSRVDMLAGYRYMRLADSLTISENAESLQPEFPVAFQIFDQFDTRNQFHGVDLGVAWQSGWRKWSGEFLLKTALGNVQQDVNIRGGTTMSQAGGAAVDHAGGLLALPSNIGSYSQDRFTVIPEIGVNLYFSIFPRLRASLGYTLIYWGNAVRPGEHIDRDINPDQLPPPILPMEGALRPEFSFQERDYWAQGFSAGIEGRW